MKQKIKFEAVLSTAQTLGLQIVEAFGTQVAIGGSGENFSCNFRKIQLLKK